MRFDNLSSTNQRIVGACFLLPIAIVFFYSPMAASVFLMVLGGLMGLELANMLGHAGLRRIGLGLCLAGIALPAGWFGLDQTIHVVQITVLAILAGALSSRVGQPKLVLFGILIALCLAAAGMILAEPDGHILMLALAAVIAACDTTAYFVGRLIGGPKLAPSISPKKTVSGAVGGIAGAVFVMIFCAPLFGVTVTWAVLAGGALAVLAQIGDLLESAVKRTLHVKDSGTIIPGHGGVLDRFDGYILTVPAAFLILF